MYFQKFESERGSNRGSEGRVDFLLGRLRPHLFGAVLDSHERPNNEIDARAHRRQTGYGAGFGFLMFAHTSATGEYRRSSASYAEDEFFDGVRLADALNTDTETMNGGIELELTPLTSISFNVERTEERFPRTPSRDADTRRYGATVTFQPGALISGRAQLAYLDFKPRSSDIPPLDGLAAAVALSYAFRDQTRFTVTVDRDIRYSFADLTPYLPLDRRPADRHAADPRSYRRSSLRRRGAARVRAGRRVAGVGARRPLAHARGWHRLSTE